MFSGGLDSTIAVHMMQRQGLDVLALHFVLPFYSGIGLSHAGIKARAAALNVPLRIEEEGQEYLDMFRTRLYGFGKNINPCVDCRIHRLTKAAIIMKQEGASFIATGEVVGQRPMSQRRDCLTIIENESGLKGLILRPLCAKTMKPTLAEENGWVQRDELFGWGGRGRKSQMAYAEKFNLSYPTPAGGCLLTHARSAERYADLAKYNPEFSINDFKLVAHGRHFRLSPRSKLIMARYDSENDPILNLAQPQDWLVNVCDIIGPLGILRGDADDELIKKACAIFTKYTRARDMQIATVKLERAGETRIVAVVPANETECESVRV